MGNSSSSNSNNNGLPPLGFQATGESVLATLPGGYTNVKNQTVLITGGNSGLGLETARVLAKAGSKVIIASRTQKNAEEAIKSIKEKLPNLSSENIDYILLDLADQKQIKQATDKFLTKYNKLNILINNAGVMACPLNHTKDGYELQFGTNHLGHYSLTKNLLPLLESSGTPTNPSRIINLSSMGHWIFSDHTKTPISFDDLEAKQAYNPWNRYGQSKLANVLHAKYLQYGFDNGVSNEINKTKNIVAVALHPGAILDTNLSRYFALGMTLNMLSFPRIWKVLMTEPYKSIPQGVATTIFCAAAPIYSNTNTNSTSNAIMIKPGAYYSDCHEINKQLNANAWIHPEVNNVELQKQLWDVSKQSVEKILSKA